MKLEERILKDIHFGLIKWIKEILKDIGGNKVVIGISGGKDSSIVAALCVEALGKNNVIGVLMPDGPQQDISFAYEICEYLDIHNITIPIDSITKIYLQSIDDIKKDIVPEVTAKTKLNLPPRVRMTILYGISQSIPKSRVVHTGNLSEKWIGYTTLYGDNTGAFSPLGMLTSSEVIQLGRFIGLPENFIEKPPADGLTGKTDETVLGFSYDILNKYIREGIIEDKLIKEKIDNLHRSNLFKFTQPPVFTVDLPIYGE